MDTEFVNAYIQRMLALNNDLTNKNVMLEARMMLLETKYNALAQAYNTMVEASTTAEEAVKEDPQPIVKKADKKQDKQNESF